ncbi:MAG: hypothetical protein ACYC3B_06555 [Sedimentisphaerales bacterium]
MIDKDNFGIIWLVFLFICIVIGIVKGAVERITRDKAAHNVLDSSFDCEKEKAEILAISKKFGFKKTEIKKTTLAMLVEKHQLKKAWGNFIKNIKIDEE